MSTSAEAVAHPVTTAESLRREDIGLLLLRVIPFGLLTFHGSQKLFGAFGGPGLDGTTQIFRQLGYQPAEFFAVLGGTCEFVGGLLLLLGLLTPLGSALALGNMINAVAATISGGISPSGYAIMLAVIAATLAITGPGRISIDHGRPWERTGGQWAAASIGLGVAAAIITLLIKNL